MDVTSSKDGFLERKRIMLVGSPKQGKTVAAATLSPKFKDKGDLDDLLYWQFDQGGTESLTGLGLSAPVLRFDQLPLRDERNKIQWAPFWKAVTESYQLTRDRIKKGLTKTVILDTLSTFDALADAYYAQIYPDQKQTGQRYGNLLQTHLTFCSMFMDLDCDVVVNCHAKFKSDPIAGGNDAKDQATQKSKAMLMNPGARITPLITGRALSHWTGQMSVIWPVTVVRDGKGKVTKVNIHPHGGGDWEGGTRYTGLSEREEANLYDVFKKIEGANK